MAAGTTTELPRIGDVLSYIYLFKHEASTRDEGIKQRPVVVIDVDRQTEPIAFLDHRRVELGTVPVTPHPVGGRLIDRGGEHVRHGSAPQSPRIM